MDEQKRDQELWQPMVDYTTRELESCLDILRNRVSHSEDSVALSALKLLAERVTRLSVSLNSVRALHDSYDELFSLFQDHISS